MSVGVWWPSILQGERSLQADDVWVVLLHCSHGIEVNHVQWATENVGFEAGQGMCKGVGSAFHISDVSGELGYKVQMLCLM